MKRLICVLVFAFILLVILFFSLKPTILFITKKELSHIFVNSKVKIGSCTLNPLRELRFLNIEIKKEPLYAFGAGRIDFNFAPSSILKGRILKVTLGDVAVKIDPAGSSILELNKHLKLGSGKAPFSVGNLELSNLSFDLNSKEFNAKARLSSIIDLKNLEIKQIDLGVDALDSFGLVIENASLKAGQHPSIGALDIAKVKYDKAVISQIKANARLQGCNLILYSLSAKLLNGDLKGNLSLGLDKEGEYRGELEFINLDMENFVKDFELQEKFQLSGKLSGYVKFKGRGQDIQVIDGNLSVNEDGGMLTISDTQYLEGLARNSGRSLDILVESFKNYHYNKARLVLSIDSGDLIFNADLEGESGKRNLTVVLHDFNLRRSR